MHIQKSLTGAVHIWQSLRSDLWGWRPHNSTAVKPYLVRSDHWALNACCWETCICAVLVLGGSFGLVVVRSQHWMPVCGWRTSPSFMWSRRDLPCMCQDSSAAQPRGVDLAAAQRLSPRALSWSNWDSNIITPKLPSVVLGSAISATLKEVRSCQRPISHELLFYFWEKPFS